MLSWKKFDRRGSLAGAAMVALMALGMPIQSHAANPASISGKWVGTGIVKLEAGNTERVSCRVQYGRIAGQNFSVAARCATTGTRLDQTGELKRISANRYIGDLHNIQFNVSAKVIVTVSGSKQTVSISNKHGSASIQLKRR